MGGVYTLGWLNRHKNHSHGIQVYLTMLSAATFKIFSGYYDQLYGHGYVLSDLVGDPYKFLGLGKYNTHGLKLRVGVGTEDSIAIYDLRFEKEDIYLNSNYKSFSKVRTEINTCSLTGTTGNCYAYDIRLSNKGILNNLYWMPRLRMGAEVVYRNSLTNISGTMGHELMSWETRYRINVGNGTAEYVLAEDLSILAKGDIVIPLINYTTDRGELPLPKGHESGMPMIYWDVFWPGSHRVHYWAHSYAEDKQILPVKKYWEK